jgi:hypothetical protein
MHTTLNVCLCWRRILTDVRNRMSVWARMDRFQSFFKQGLIQADIETSITSVNQVVERLQVPRVVM